MAERHFPGNQYTRLDGDTVQKRYCPCCGMKKVSDFWRSVPRNDDNRRRWSEIVGVDLKSSHTLCSLHFDSSDDDEPMTVPFVELSPEKRALEARLSHKKRRLEFLDDGVWQVQTELQHELQRKEQLLTAKEEELKALKEHCKELKSEKRLLMSEVEWTTKKMTRAQAQVDSLQSQLTSSRLFRIENFADDPISLRHFVLLRWEQFVEVARKLEGAVEARGGLSSLIYRRPKTRHRTLKLDYLNLLAIVLLRLRRAFTHQTLATLFDISVSYVSRVIKALLPVIVDIVKPAVRLDRDMLVPHTPATILAKFRSPTVAMDCTYIYTEHSENFSLQMATWSQPKQRNLLKILVVAYLDGTIAAVFGPFGTDHDDTVTEMALEDERFQGFFRIGDILFVDRGFRLGDKLLERYGVSAQSPAYLRDAQFTPEEIAHSRLNASIRSVVENVNPRLKQPLLHHITTKELPLLQNWVQLSAALCNMAYEPLRPGLGSDGANNDDEDDDSDLEDDDPAADMPAAEEDEDEEDEDEDEDVGLQVVWDEPLSMAKYKARQWKQQAPVQDLGRIPLTYALVQQLCEVASCSPDGKSQIERGVRYLENPRPKMSALMWKKDGQHILCKASCFGSYRTNTGERHHLLCDMSRTQVRISCDCYNGRGVCAHKAALLVDISLVRSGMSRDDLDINKRNLRTVAAIRSIQTKRVVEDVQE